jgi:hypothetical protein
MRRIRRNPKVVATGSAWIDPVGCDSTISYKVVKHTRLSGQVDLSDCNRKISWWFRNEPESVVKIDKAISMLQEFRAAFVDGQKNFKKPRVRKAK